MHAAAAVQGGQSDRWMRDGKIVRDEVFFDRAVLAPLLAGKAA